MQNLDTYTAAKFIAISAKKPVVLLTGIDVELAKQISIVAYTSDWLSDDDEGAVIFLVCDSNEEADDLMARALSLRSEDGNYFNGYQFDRNGYCMDSLAL